MTMYLVFNPLLWLTLAALWAVGGHAEEPPADLQAIHAAVKERVWQRRNVNFGPQGSAGGTRFYTHRDFTYVPKDESRWGNCSTHAKTAQKDFEDAGYPAVIKVCKLPDGTTHAWAKVGPWASDQRFESLIPITREADCTPLFNRKAP